MYPLKTLKGSKICYSKYGVGKEIGGKIYIHKDYALEVIPTDVLNNAQDMLHKYEPCFEFNCVCYNKKQPNIVRFDEAPDFNTEREPHPGVMFTVDTSINGEGCYKYRYSDLIWYHKWLWVDENYKGFNVVVLLFDDKP